MKNNFANIDIDRHSRQGFPEAIYCPGKTIQQIVTIAKKMHQATESVLATRADEKIYKAVKKILPKARYNKLARMIVVSKKSEGRQQKVDDKSIQFSVNSQQSTRYSYICVVTAGTSDIPVAEEAFETAESLGSVVERVYDVGVSGIHRLLKHHDKLQNASCVIICAGMEGALASVVGGLVRCPVIGVPTSIGYGVSFQGVSALLTMLNSCAANVSVVNIDDGFGAGVVAHLIDFGNRKSGMGNGERNE
ncbi:MAG: nickel pincer cofactor biosynthesis protein LarB [Elusimicrobia bacterium]|nr:nickel pincer cofactor biosynthesis protein LarB [Candidatus Obscuribacterium magneticum]